MPRRITNPYEVLGLDSGATDADIRTAYLRLAKKYHPDKNPGDKASEWIFREIQRAYETLRNANEAGSTEQNRPPAPQEGNARARADPARQWEQQAEEAEREGDERWERQQAEDAHRRWERAQHAARRDGGTEPVCDECGSVNRWWSNLPSIVQLGVAWIVWTVWAGFLGFVFSIFLFILLIGVQFTLVVVSSLTGWSPPVIEALNDVNTPLSLLLGFLLAFGYSIWLEEMPKVCPQCGRVSV